MAGPRRQKNNSKAAAAAAAAAPKSTEAAWVPTEIAQWDVERLRPADRNPRKHPKEQIAQLAERYAKVGFTKPLLVRPDGRLIAGHGRLDAARLAGLKTVPVIVAPDAWSDQQCREELLADNALGDGSKWDESELAAELKQLSDEGSDLAALGFEPLEDAKAPDATPQLHGLQYSIVVKCRDEAHQLETLTKFEAEGLECRALIS